MKILFWLLVLASLPVGLFMSFTSYMAYGLDLKCYAYTRDKRPMGVKYMGGTWTEDAVYDNAGEKIENMDLPFSDCLVGACKIVEGKFSDCLRTFMEDVEEESKAKAMRGRVEKRAPHVKNPSKTGRPVVYLGDCHRGESAGKRHAEMKKVLEKYGFEAYTPSDYCDGVPVLQQTDDPYARAYNRFDHYQQHVRDCDIYVMTSRYEGKPITVEEAKILYKPIMVTKPERKFSD